MGGQSFNCPLCDKWVLTRLSLRDHIKDKHKLNKIEREEIMDGK